MWNALALDPPEKDNQKEESVVTESNEDDALDVWGLDPEKKNDGMEHREGSLTESDDVKEAKKDAKAPRRGKRMNDQEKAIKKKKGK